MKKISTLLFLIILSMSNAFSKYPQWHNFVNASEADCLVADGKYLWLGFANGIIKFDTETEIAEHIDMTNSELPGQYVRCMILDKKGVLWAGTSTGGLATFDGNKWTADEEYLNNGGGKSISALYEDNNGNIWAGDAKGVTVYDGVKWTRYDDDKLQHPDKITGITADADGDIWFATESRTIYKFDGNEWTIIDFEGTYYDDLGFNSAFTDSKGNLWFGTIEYGLLKYEDEKWTRLDFDDTGLNNNVTCVIEDTDGNIWAASHTSSGGVVYFDGEKWNKVRLDMSSNTVNAMVQNDQGMIWFGADYSSLICLNGEEIKKYSNLLKSIPSNRLRAVAEDKYGNIWVGTKEDGIGIFDGNEWSVLNIFNSDLPSNEIISLKADKKGDIWIASNSEYLAKYDGSQWHLFDEDSTGFQNKYLIKIEADRQGDIWFCARNNLYKYVNNEFIKEITLHDSFYSFFEDENGVFWIGTEGYGIYLVNGSEVEIIRMGTNSIPNDLINDICEDGAGNIWVASQPLGTGVYDGSRWKTYERFPNGTSSISSYYLFRDQNNSLWISTLAGVTRYDGTNWETFSSSNSGYIGGKVYDMMQDSEGRLWFMTVFGASLFNPDIVNIEEKDDLTPGFALNSFSYPNPFESNTTIFYQTEFDTRVKITISNSLGNTIDCLVDEYQNAGEHKVLFDAGNLSSGLYFYTIQIGNSIETGAIVVLK